MAIKYGTNGADTLIGTNAADSLYGRGGNDLLKGLGGDDLLLGGLGNDRIEGGAGRDLASWNADGGTQAVTIDLGAGRATRGAETDTLSGIENAKGSAYDDTIRGSNGDNVLHGAPGNDTIYGLAGNDVFVSGPGDDGYDGGDGRDLLDYSGVSGPLDGWGIQANLGSGQQYSQIVSIDGTDRFLTEEGIVEGVIGTRFSDRMIGSFGGSGDTFSGGAGNDVLYGQTGSDTLSGGTGADWISPDQTLDDSASMGDPDILDFGSDASQDIALFAFSTEPSEEVAIDQDRVRGFDKSRDLLSFEVTGETGERLDVRDFLDSNDDGRITAADQEVSRSGQDLVLDIGAVFDRAFGTDLYSTDTVTVAGAGTGFAADRIVSPNPTGGPLIGEDMLF